MEKSNWFLNPITVFALSIVALVTSLTLFIYWYIQASIGIKTVVRRFGLDPGEFLASQPWVVILVLSLLVGIILIGIFFSFLYYLKVVQLYRLQNNFINNFTHELKTPVTSMKLYLETFLKHELSRENQEKYLQYMLQDVDRLSDNVTRILSLGRIESKRYEGEFINTNIVEVILNFIKHNARIFGEYDINVHYKNQEKYNVRLSMPLFEMLLMNLISNAIKYNQSKAPKIDISFETQKKRLFIHFVDNGIGLEKKERKKIFRKFYQVGRSDNMSAKGSGLGLYLVNNIVRIHKWKIKAHSNETGQGSDFILSIPIR
ncbi:MAG: HAMP domain-containing histidine kinase [Proteobacteria bacterium]|nr:HAMP domain-containing histidine kinase [Pseudomonadota bacterium]